MSTAIQGSERLMGEGGCVKERGLFGCRNKAPACSLARQVFVHARSFERAGCCDTTSLAAAVAAVATKVRAYVFLKVALEDSASLRRLRSITTCIF